MNITINNVTKRFESLPVYENYSRSFQEGAWNILGGPSGCGKTTLINMILGFEKPDAGSIIGVPTKVSVVFQEDRLCMGFSALENVLSAGSPRNKVEAMLILEELGLDRPDALVSTLSGGQKRRVAIARALFRQADLYIFDEPFKGLDEETLQRVRSCMERRTAGKTVILVTH